MSELKAPTDAVGNQSHPIGPGLGGGGGGISLIPSLLLLTGTSEAASSRDL